MIFASNPTAPIKPAELSTTEYPVLVGAAPGSPVMAMIPVRAWIT